MNMWMCYKVEISVVLSGLGIEFLEERSLRMVKTDVNQQLLLHWECLWISLLNTNPDQQPTVEGSNAWMISFRIWGFPKIGVPPNHPLIDRIFHEINQLFWMPPFHLVVSQSFEQCSPQRWCESWTNRSIRSQSSTISGSVSFLPVKKS